MIDDRIRGIIDRHRGRPEAAVQVLMEIQGLNRWLPREVLTEVSEKLGVPLSDIRHLATFYKTFSLSPPGRHEVHVCNGSSCRVRGAKGILDEVQNRLGIRSGETTADGRFTLEEGNCLGCCSLGPELIIDGEHFGRITPEQVDGLLKKYD